MRFVNETGGARAGTGDRGVPSQWETVYHETRRRILTLELAPGTPISEVTVAEEFGTSPTPARDALGRLRQEGLVVLERGRRYAVAPLTMRDISELAELRFVLETGIARVAMNRATPERLEVVRDVARSLEEPGLSFAQRVERNQAFHLEVAGLTDNDRVVDTLRRVLEDSQRIFHLGITGLTIDEMIETHRRLIDAIANGDVEAATHVCEIEAFGTAERVLNQLLRGSPGGREGPSAASLVVSAL